MATLIEPLSTTIDTAFLGHINTSWVAVLAIVASVLNSTTWIFNFLVHASTSQLAEIDWNKDGNILLQRVKIALIVPTVLGILMMLSLFVFHSLILDIFHYSTELQKELVSNFLQIRYLSVPFTLLLTSLYGVLRGKGEVKFVFYNGLLITFLNVTLNYLCLFIFKLSLESAAIMTNISLFTGAAVAFIKLVRGEQVSIAKLIASKVDKKEFFEFGKHSINIFIRSGTLTSVFFLASVIASRMGELTLATHQILLQCWLLVSFITDGFAITANIVVAKLQDNKDLKKWFNKLLVSGIITGVFFTFIFLIFEKSIYGLFTDDSRVLDMLGLFWPLIFIPQITNASSYVFDGILFGLKGFAYLRTHMLLGAIIFVVPCYLTAYYSQEYQYIWWGLILLNTHRLFSCFVYLKRRMS